MVSNEKAACFTRLLFPFNICLLLLRRGGFTDRLIQFSYQLADIQTVGHRPLLQRLAVGHVASDTEKAMRVKYFDGLRELIDHLHDGHVLGYLGHNITIVLR